MYFCFSHARARARGSGIFLGFWQFSAEAGLRPTILRFSKNVYFLRESVAGCMIRPFPDVVWLYFSRARAREGFGDISGIPAVFGGG